MQPHPLCGDLRSWTSSNECVRCLRVIPICLFVVIGEDCDRMLKFCSEHSLRNCGAIGCLKLDVLRFFRAMSYELHYKEWGSFCTQGLNTKKFCVEVFKLSLKFWAPIRNTILTLGSLVEHLLNAFINTLSTLEGLADNTCLHIYTKLEGAQVPCWEEVICVVDLKDIIAIYSVYLPNCISNNK